MSHVPNNGLVVTNEVDPAFGQWKTNATNIAIGKSTLSKDGYKVTIGPWAKNSVSLGTVVGYNAIATNDAIMAIGSKSFANGYMATAIGPYSEASLAYGLALGYAAWSDARCGISIGPYVLTTNKYAVTIGGRFNHSGATVSMGDETFNLSTPDPAHFWFNAYSSNCFDEVQGRFSTNSAAAPQHAKNLQWYLDQRATKEEVATMRTDLGNLKGEVDGWDYSWKIHG